MAWTGRSVDWDETQHPRHPAGDEHGGEFRGKIGNWVAQAAHRLVPHSLRESIASGILYESKFVGGNSGAHTTRIPFDDGTWGLRKRMTDDPARGMSAERQADAEELVALLGRSLDAPVPEVIRTSETEVMMRLVEGQAGAWHLNGSPWSGDWEAFYKSVRADPHPSHLRLGLLDALIDNHDRWNAANWVMGVDGQIWGIDHAMAMNFGMPLHGEPGLPSLSMPGPFGDMYGRGWRNSPNPTWTKNRLSKADGRVLLERVDRLRGAFEAAGRGEWWQVIHARAVRIAAKAGGTEDIL